MSKTKTMAGSVGEGSSFSNRFLQFWFQPQDPTVLGWIRIVVGLLIVYVHLAYCFDLRSFFGPYAWYGLEQINRERTEKPFLAPSLENWDAEYATGFMMPNAPHRREAIRKFLLALPDDPRQRDSRLEYLYSIPADPVRFQQGISFIELFPLDDQRKGERLELILTVGPNDEPSSVIPPMIQSEPLGKRREDIQQMVIRLLELMPDDREQRRYVLEWFQENVGYPTGNHLRDFIRNLPRDPEERKAAIEYLMYWNVDRSKVYAEGTPIWSLWFHITSPSGMWTAHIIILVIMVLFTAGFCTRLTGVLTWLAVLSYLHRSQQVLFGADVMMNIVLIYLVIGPSGAALSIDRLIQRYRIIRASYRRSGRIDDIAQLALDRPVPTRSAGVAIRLMQVHFCFVYIAAGLAKLKGTTWWDHSSMWLTTVNPEFSPVNIPMFESLMRFVASTPMLFAVLSAFGVAFTLFVEIGFPFLIWTRLRPYMMMGSVLLHFGIAICMGLTVFSLFMMAFVFCFVSPQALRERLAGGPDLARLRLRFRSDQRRQLRKASLVGALDVSGQVKLIDRSQDETHTSSATPEPLEVIDSDGQSSRGFEAIATLLRKVRLMRVFMWLLWIPGFAALGRALFPDKSTSSGNGASPPNTTPSKSVVTK